MKPSSATLIIVISLFIANTVFGTGPAVQHQFRGGDPASATQVNENFQELADRIQENKDLLKTYDYRDYITPPNVSTKTFSEIAAVPNQTPSECELTTRIRNYSRTPQGIDTLLTLTEISVDPNTSQTCISVKVEYLETPTGLLSLKTTQYDVTNSAHYTERFSPEGILVRTSSMRVGGSWGSVSTLTLSDYYVEPPILNQPQSNSISQYTLLSVEDVTVPYDNGRADNNPTTYSGCLKILRNRGNGSFGVEWYCPDIGLVKLMGVSKTIVLTDMNT
jgi:hypothetical protein